MGLNNSTLNDKKLVFTLFSYILVAVIFMNLSVLQSPIVGVVASFIYISINGIFLGHAFFENHDSFFGFVLGSLLFVALLGFIGWIVLDTGSLDLTGTTLVLLIGTTVSSLLNIGMEHKNA